MNMIYLSINTHDYDNDVRVMTGAFYPGVKIVTDNEETCDMSVRVNVTDAHIQAVIACKDKLHKVDETASSNDRKTVRDHLKRSLYAVYSQLEGRELPWGTLTGIRPTKIPMKLIEEGRADDEIKSYMKTEYLISDQKAELSLKVAHNEHDLLQTIDYDNGYSLYIGIPFCPTTCLYCSFTSYPLGMWKNRVDDYITALLKELAFIAQRMKGRELDSIYIGGGTPTTLLPYQFDRLFTFIENNFDISTVREYTVEAGRPDSIDKDKLMMLRAHNIDRISINPQTMNQKTLDLIGRRHSVEQIYEAYALARECGFDNINMDLIFGLPGESREDIEHTLSEVQRLAPDNLTVHSLAIKRAAGLNIYKDLYADYSINNSESIIELAHEAANRMGMEPYYLYRQKNMAGNLENVGFACDGKKGVYNILIMEEKQSIIAAGANAQSKLVVNHGQRVDRIENVKNVEEYIDRVDEMIERKRRYFDADQ